jgi:lysophospholipid acyltransferase (LPLAT)-like uncharacterized protein
MKLALAPPVWRLVSHSWRLEPTRRLADDPAGPVVFACLHRDILAAICYCRPARPALLVSKSDDGQILMRTLARDGFRFVRGSTGHDGREGYVGLLRELRAGHHVGVAVDGPRGPFGHVHPGALQLARRAGVPIVPLTVTGRGCVQLRTWDRTVAPLPWARLTVTAQAPIIVPPEADADTIARLTAELATVLTSGGAA